jgi:hypothetical protein
MDRVNATISEPHRLEVLIYAASPTVAARPQGHENTSFRRHSAVFALHDRYQEWQQRSASHLFIGMAMSLFRVTKSTGDLLALVKATDPPSALEAYARMRGHLSFARLASACGLAFAHAQKAFVTQEVGQRPALLMGSPE